MVMSNTVKLVNPDQINSVHIGKNPNFIWSGNFLVRDKMASNFLDRDKMAGHFMVWSKLAGYFLHTIKPGNLFRKVFIMWYL